MIENLEGFGIVAVPVQHIGQADQHVHIVGLARKHETVFGRSLGVAVFPGEKAGSPAMSLHVGRSEGNAGFGKGKSLIEISLLNDRADL